MRKWMQKVMLRLRASAPKLRALWGKYGYAISMVLLLALVGTGGERLPRRGARGERHAGTDGRAHPGGGRRRADARRTGTARMDRARGRRSRRALQPGRARVESDPGAVADTCGVDIAAPLGASVVACAQGTVSQAGFDALLGNCVRIEHADGLQSVYGSLQNLEMVEVGKRVQAGEVIGAVGDSAAAEAHLGAHLHFALMRDGESQPPLAQQDGETDARSDAQ